MYESLVSDALSIFPQYYLYEYYTLVLRQRRLTADRPFAIRMSSWFFSLPLIIGTGQVSHFLNNAKKISKRVIFNIEIKPNSSQHVERVISFIVNSLPA